ncbi:hypothetical protein BDV19DRAFT_187686 [Aspergillus venezuelensis]
MGVNQRVKTKYVFRLPISFFKTKRMNVKGDGVDTTTSDEDVEGSTYASVPHTTRVRYDSNSEVESETDPDDDIDPLDISVPAVPAPRQRKRLVSWDGVDEQARNRWTAEQEERLVHARAELARCQRAWSSEQDVWLKCVDELSEEKAAHQGFINNRAKHIGDEQNNFRKVCSRNRRRSEQDQLQGQPQRLTRAHRTGSLPVRLSKLRGKN